VFQLLLFYYQNILSLFKVDFPFFLQPILDSFIHMLFDFFVFFDLFYTQSFCLAFLISQPLGTEFNNLLFLFGFKFHFTLELCSEVVNRTFKSEEDVLELSEILHFDLFS